MSSKLCSTSRLLTERRVVVHLAKLSNLPNNNIGWTDKLQQDQKTGFKYRIYKLLSIGIGCTVGLVSLSFIRKKPGDPEQIDEYRKFTEEDEDGIQKEDDAALNVFNASFDVNDYVLSDQKKSSLRSSIWTELLVKTYPIVPTRLLSTILGKLSVCHVPVSMRNIVYGSYCKTYECDMDEAINSDYRHYKNMSELFRRKLKPSTRPISEEPGIVSPADGLLLHFGPVSEKLEKVKGIKYSVKNFLGLSFDEYDELLHDKENNELYQCIVYLAPGDYHRFHSPTKWSVQARKHFPGFLLSVRPNLLRRMPEVLHINERVCYIGNWKHGFFSMTAVGATSVGSIKVSFDKDLRTNRRTLWPAIRYDCYEHRFSEQPNLDSGQDFGEFNFGSTIVLIFEAPKNTTFEVKANQKIKYGQLVAKIASHNQDKTK